MRRINISSSCSSRRTYSEAKRVAEILAREDSGAGRDLLKIIEDAELRPTTAQLDKALKLAQTLLQDALDAFRGREPLYCVCRRAFIDSIASIRCQRCNDWYTHSTRCGKRSEAMGWLPGSMTSVSVSPRTRHYRIPLYVPSAANLVSYHLRSFPSYVVAYALQRSSLTRRWSTARSP